MTTASLFHTVTVGDAQIAIIQDGELIEATAELFKDLPSATWAGQWPAAGAGQIRIPVHLALVRVDGEVILIDTGLGTAPVDGGRGGRLAPALAELGLTPDDVTRVVITHMHGDHVGGLLVDEGGAARLAFPRARHHLPRVDWEWTLGYPDERYRQFLHTLEELAHPTLDEPDDRLTASLRSVGAPGHTPGHRCLVVESGGQGFCFLGDLVHAPALHFAEPERVTAWDAEPALTPPSRRRLAAQAVAGDWLLAATHAAFPALGRLTPAGPAGWTWRPADR